jgi:NADH dehydrogenase
VTSTRRITVFGGTGFLGRRVVRHLYGANLAVRIATRHPDRARSLFSGDDFDIESVLADVNKDDSVAAAVEGAWAAVNAVSLYVERGRGSFHSVHVEAAGRVARISRHIGLERLVHLSGVGADERSPSLYICKRAEGEQAVRRMFPSATIIRPAVMFGHGDAFVTPILKLMRYLPLFPMFGRGRTRLQPAYVDDVAEAIMRVLQVTEPRAVYELGGPKIYTYRALLKTIARRARRKPILLPVPFGMWRCFAYVAEMLPRPPITRNQIELMQIDNVATSGMPGFGDLQLLPHPVEEVLSRICEGKP